MHVIRLHSTLLPPAKVGALDDVAQENYSMQIASEVGLEYLRSNWRVLLIVLFPCLPPGVAPLPVDREEGEALDAVHRTHASPDIEPSCLEACASYPMSTVDLNALREPGMMDRIYYSYVVLLRFLGWRMHDEKRGLLDRHRNWEARYNLLRPDAAVLADWRQGVDLLQAPLAPPYGHYHFYVAALWRSLQCFLSVGFLTFAVRLVEFLIEEMSCGRLDFLSDFVREMALPLLQGSADIEASHLTRLQKRFTRLTESDSD